MSSSHTCAVDKLVRRQVEQNMLMSLAKTHFSLVIVHFHNEAEIVQGDQDVLI